MNVETAKEQALFEAALPMGNPIGRAAFLDEACKGDPGLRARVVKLLAVHADSERFFRDCISDFATAARDLPPSEANVAAEISGEMTGTRVGRYKLLKPLGEGGCGVVYLAEQEEPVRRRVALKVIKLGMDTHEVIARFESERQALALMDHPHIARVLDAVRNDELYVFTHPNMRDQVDERFAAIQAAMDKVVS